MVSDFEHLQAKTCLSVVAHKYHNLPVNEEIQVSWYEFWSQQQKEKKRRGENTICDHMTSQYRISS